VENEGETKKIYSVSDIKNLEDIFESEIQELEKKQKNLKKIIPGLVIKTQKLEPKIHFYAGANGIIQVLKDLLWYKNIETLTMWPISDMVEILGRDYLEELNRRRIRQRISIRGIWPANKVVDLKNHPYLGIGKEHLRQLRLAPKSMSWDMSYWLYEDKVAFISSNNESFGFIIHSQDFVNLMRTQFEVIWKLSKPIEPQREYTDSFLRTV
jgi:sugar-specific transcriptional regulator TrmB